MKKRRVGSLLICLALVFQLLPVTAQAEEGAAVLLVNGITGSDSATRADGATYQTVQGAIAAAADGDTVRLDDNVTATALITMADRRLTLDLNGHTLTTATYTGGSTSAYTAILCRGTADLTITDTSAEQDGTLYLDKRFSPAPVGFYLDGSARLTVKRCVVDTSGNALQAVYNYSTNAFALVEDLDAPKGELYTALGAYIGLSETMFREAATRLREVSAGSGGNLSANALGGVGLCLSGRACLTSDVDLGNLLLFAPLGGSLTLDLAGHNLRGDRAVIHVLKNSAVTLTNSGTGDAEHGVVAHNSPGTEDNTILSQGALTLNRGVSVRNSAANGGKSSLSNTANLAAVKSRGLNTILTSVTVNDGATVLATGAQGIGIWDAFQTGYAWNCTRGSITLNDGGRVEATSCAIYGEYGCAIRIAGGTVKSATTAPVQSGEGYLTVSGGQFITPLAGEDSAPLCGVCAAAFADEDDDFQILPPGGSVSQATFSGVDITARDSGIYLHTKLHNGPLVFDNITVNKDTGDTAAKVGITNLSGKDITITGKDSYYVCEQIYATTPDPGHRPVGTPVQPAGKLSITAGIYSVDPSPYVPADGEGNKAYAVLRLSDAPYRDLVAPWTRVGVDNRVSLHYPSGATSATDKVDIEFLDDVDNLAGELEAKHFTLSASEGVYTAVSGLAVTGFTGGNRLEIAKEKGTAVPGDKAYVWYGGKSVGAVVFDVADAPTCDVEGSIDGAAEGLPTAKLVRDGVVYPAAVAGDSSGYRYHVSVPQGEYNLVVSATVGGQPVTVTVLVSVQGQVVKDVVLPGGAYNSIVTVEGASTPNLEAGGLDDMAAALGASAAHTQVLIELRGEENEASSHAPKVIERIEADGMAKGVLMDLDLLQSINQGQPTRIGQVSADKHGIALITVVFHLPEAVQGKEGYAIYRYHDGQVDTITETPNADGEALLVDEEKTTITAQLKKFSTYAIAYREGKHLLTVKQGAGGGRYGTGTAIPIAADPAGAGKAFKEWVLLSGSGVIAAPDSERTVFTMGAGDAVVAATYRDLPPAPSYTARFLANGGTGTMAEQAFAPGTAQPLAENAFVRDGYTFWGWAETPDASAPRYCDGETVVLTQDTDLYAVWRAEAAGVPDGGPQTGDVSTCPLGALLAAGAGLGLARWQRKRRGA